MRVVITDHARFQLRRRQIEEDAVRQVALTPEHVVTAYRTSKIDKYWLCEVER